MGRKQGPLNLTNEEMYEMEYMTITDEGFECLLCERTYKCAYRSSALARARVHCTSVRHYGYLCVKRGDHVPLYVASKIDQFLYP